MQKSSGTLRQLLERGATKQPIFDVVYSAHMEALLETEVLKAPRMLQTVTSEGGMSALTTSAEKASGWA